MTRVAFRGVHLAPGLLRKRDLIAGLNGTDFGDVLPPPRYADLVKPEGRGRNETDVARFSHDLAERIRSVAGPGRFVVLVGGDCSILLGALLGLRVALQVPVGLVYIDAHADFATLAESPSGSACSMNLALAVGRSATPLARLDGAVPLVRGDQVVHIGRRDDHQPEYGYPALREWGVLDLSQARLEREGIAVIAARALDRVGQLDHYWVHFDVDVLDPQVMPAVTPIEGGFDFAGVQQLLTLLIGDPRALGLQLTIYDPSLDDGAAARRLVDLLESAIRRGLRDG